MFKRMTAAFLLLVLLFIHVGKLAHHHSDRSFKTHDSLSTKSFKSSDCSICDYHFTKDAVDELPLAFTSHAEAGPVVLIDYLSPRLTSIGLTSSGRGPPAAI